ncbi:MAG: homoserine kinase [Gemmatimonadetes bacterium]|nr:homoserine kinase [Gemmatimonadota bacterium]
MGPTTGVVTAFAPASVSNLGPGFDVLGLALEGPGDTVTARVVDGPGVRIARIEGERGALPRQASANTAGIAAAATLGRAGARLGVELELVKGLPIGSGLGSSAASAVAAAFAVNQLLGEPLGPAELLEACLEAEATVSGRHADNVAPALLGGLVAVRSVSPLDVVRLPVPAGLVVVVVTPAFELSTRTARAALPQAVPLAAMVRNSANLAALVAACCTGDLALLGRSIEDEVVTPVRAGLIPGCVEVMAAAREAGALGASISGAGPSIFALCDLEDRAVAAAFAMQAAFERAGLPSKSVISRANCPGARLL